MSKKASLLLFHICLFWASWLLFTAAAANAYSIKIGWDPNVEPDLEGYNLYYSEGSLGPPFFWFWTYQVKDLADPQNPMVVISGLDRDVNYYFVLTAYNMVGNESYYSNIVSVLNGTGKSIEWSNMKLISPNGGEIIQCGALYTIEWIAPTQAETVKIQYSPNNGKKWKTIKNDAIGRAYNWRVPILKNNKKNCKVRIIGYDALKRKIGKDVSDAPFKLEKFQAVAITSPNGGEKFKAGNMVSIKWNTDQTIDAVAQVVMKFSFDNGKKWKIIDKIKDKNTGIYMWTVPSTGIPKNRCVVKILLYDANGKLLGQDTSNTYFRIEP
jgi:hypothetical protein